MTAADAFFLAADRPGSPQVIGGLVLLTGSEDLTPEAAVERLVDGLHAAAGRLPLLRERLHPRPPRWLRRPHWRDGGDPGPDAVRGEILPDEATVHRRVAELLGRPMDLGTRPWSLHVFGVAATAPDTPRRGGARLTVLFRLHHSFTDGLGVISLTRGLFDEGAGLREGKGRPATTTTTTTTATTAAAAAAARRKRRQHARDAARRRARSAGATFRGLAGLAARGAAPAVPWQGRTSAGRTLGVVEIPVKAAQAQARALGVGLTALVAASAAEGMLHLPDVAAAVASGRLRAVRAMLPVAVRSAGTWNQLGNHTAGVPLDIPLTGSSLAERARTVHEQLSQAGQEKQARAARIVVAALPKVLPPPLHRLLVRAVYGPRWFSLVVTALPGPRQRQHIAGQPVRGVGGILPLPPGVALTVGALRWTDTLTVTLLADPAALPDLAPLTDSVASLVGNREPADRSGADAGPTGQPAGADALEEPA